MACETWLRRDYLLHRGIEPEEPPCDHDPLDCPPPTGPTALAETVTAQQEP